MTKLEAQAYSGAGGGGGNVGPVPLQPQYSMSQPATPTDKKGAFGRRR